MVKGMKIAILSTAENDAELIGADMSKIVCLKHKTYQGDSSPDIQCNVCCKIYIEKIKVKNKENEEKLFYSLEEKERQKEKQKEKQKLILEKRIQRRVKHFDSSWI